MNTETFFSRIKWLRISGWASIKKTPDGKSAILMSDTVLLEEEVNSLKSAAYNNYLDISLIHNHFFYKQSRIFYMYLHGIGGSSSLHYYERGLAVTLARGFGAALHVLGKPVKAMYSNH